MTGMETEGATPPTVAADGAPGLAQRLQIGKSVGSGAFAIVHHATYDGQAVAVKVLLPHLGPTSDENCPVKMFIREGKLLRQVNHAHIVRCLAVLELPPDFPGLVRGYVRPTWALVLELLEGGSLCSLLHKQLLAPWKFMYDNATALAWSTQIASALAHLHGLSPPVIHRDVKLDNVMLQIANDGGSRTLLAKLVDLGLCTQPASAERAPSRMTLLRAPLPRGAPHRRSMSDPVRLNTVAAAGLEPPAAGAAAPDAVLRDASVRPQAAAATGVSSAAAAAAARSTAAAAESCNACDSFYAGPLGVVPSRCGSPRPATAPANLPNAAAAAAAAAAVVVAVTGLEQRSCDSGLGERTASFGRDVFGLPSEDAAAAVTRQLGARSLFYRVSDGGHSLTPVQMDPVESTGVADDGGGGGGGGAAAVPTCINAASGPNACIIGSRPCSGMYRQSQSQARQSNLSNGVRAGSFLGNTNSGGGGGGAAGCGRAVTSGPAGRGAFGSARAAPSPLGIMVGGVAAGDGVPTGVVRPGLGSGLGPGVVGSVGLTLSAGRCPTPRGMTHTMSRLSATVEEEEAAAAAEAAEAVTGSVQAVRGKGTDDESAANAGIGPPSRPGSSGGGSRPGSRGGGSRPGSRGPVVPAPSVAVAAAATAVRQSHDTGVAAFPEQPLLPPPPPPAPPQQQQQQRADGGGGGVDGGDSGITPRVTSVQAWGPAGASRGGSAGGAAPGCDSYPRDSDAGLLPIVAGGSGGSGGGGGSGSAGGVGGGRPLSGSGPCAPPGGGLVYSLSASTCLSGPGSSRPGSGGAADGGPEKGGAGGGGGLAVAGPAPPGCSSVSGWSSEPSSAVCGPQLGSSPSPACLAQQRLGLAEGQKGSKGPKILEQGQGQGHDSRPATPGDVDLSMFRAAMGAGSGGRRGLLGGFGAGFEGKVDASFSAGMEVVYCLTGETGSCMTMAPEIKLMQPYNEKIDVYAFGVVMYEIWSRSVLAVSYIGTRRRDLPYMVHRVTDWPELAASGFRPARVDAIPGPVWELITQCWDQDPLARPAMAEVEQRLRRMAEPDQAEAVIGLASGKGGRRLDAGAGRARGGDGAGAGTAGKVLTPSCACVIS